MPKPIGKHMAALFYQRLLAHYSGDLSMTVDGKLQVSLKVARHLIAEHGVGDSLRVNGRLFNDGGVALLLRYTAQNEVLGTEIGPDRKLLDGSLAEPAQVGRMMWWESHRTRVLHIEDSAEFFLRWWLNDVLPFSEGWEAK